MQTRLHGIEFALTRCRQLDLGDMENSLGSLCSRYQYSLPPYMRSVFGSLAGYASGNTICTWDRSVTTDLFASDPLLQHPQLGTAHTL
jgi:hypothetical protein